MLTINVPALRLFDEVNSKFISSEEVTLQFEHSLVSLSKWEQTFKKPFLGRDKKTTEETIGYIRAMCSDPDVSDEVLSRIDGETFKQINDYIDDKHTATWFAETKGGKISREIITSELIYYWMFSMDVPLECEHWHLNRLFTLLKVINQKNAPKKKMSPSEAMAQQRQLNEQRRAAMNSSG